MKLLFDQNLSPRLIRRLIDLFPESTRVSLIGLERSSDLHVWEYARVHGFVIITKDAGFGDLGQVFGFPPHVLWLRLGNCTTGQIEQTLRANHATIVAFCGDVASGVLSLW